MNETIHKMEFVSAHGKMNEMLLLQACFFDHITDTGVAVFQ